MEDGDFAKIDYVGKIKETGEIFDLTNEEVAKEKNAYDPRAVYGSVPIIIGNKMVLPGLEEEIKKMKTGEKKTIELKPENAFGQRDSRLIKTFSESQFRKQDLNPIPGLSVELNGIRGRILSASAGRVTVDFNHPLAGKTLVYDVEIKEMVEKDEDKIKSLVKFYSGNGPQSVIIEEKKATIRLSEKNSIRAGSKKKIADDVFKWIKLDAVKFEEVHENIKQEDNKK